MTLSYLPLPRLRQCKWEDRCYACLPQSPRRYRHRPATVDQIVHQQHRLAPDIGKSLGKFRPDHQPVPHAGEPVGAIAATRAGWTTVSRLQLPQVRHSAYSGYPLGQGIHELRFASRRDADDGHRASDAAPRRSTLGA